MPLDINLLLVFNAIFETKSVSRAAEQLGLGQPAVSTSLKRLRLVFADELFIRSSGAMQPTSRAVEIAPRLSAALAEIQGALTRAVFDPRSATRTFTIASTDYTTMVIVPGLMALIEAQAPCVDLRIVGYDKGDVPGMVERSEIDLALGVFRRPPLQTVRQLLCEEHFVGLARSGHPALHASQMTFADYLSAAHALVSVRRDAVGELDAVLLALGARRRIALTLPHMLALPAVLQSSDLIAAVPSRVATLDACRSLQTFELPVAVKPWRIEMLWHPTARADPAISWLREKIVDVATHA